MKKRAVVYLFLLLCGLAMPVLRMAQASPIQEKFSLITFFPAPYGSYNDLRAQRMAIGANYYTPGYVWGGNIAANADLVVEGGVGIGVSHLPLVTVTPILMRRIHLEVKGSAAIPSVSSQGGMAGKVACWNGKQLGYCSFLLPDTGPPFTHCTCN